MFSVQTSRTTASPLAKEGAREIAGTRSTALNPPLARGDAENGQAARGGYLGRGQGVSTMGRTGTIQPWAKKRRAANRPWPFNTWESARAEARGSLRAETRGSLRAEARPWRGVGRGHLAGQKLFH